jgi:hypothetical protein
MVTGRVGFRRVLLEEIGGSGQVADRVDNGVAGGAQDDGAVGRRADDAAAPDELAVEAELDRGPGHRNQVRRRNIGNGHPADPGVHDAIGRHGVGRGGRGIGGR